MCCMLSDVTVVELIPICLRTLGPSEDTNNKPATSVLAAAGLVFTDAVCLRVSVFAFLPSKTNIEVQM